MSRATPPGTPCLTPQCWNSATIEGRCREHYLQHKAETAPWALETESHRDLPSNWGSLRKKILARDRGICYICGGPGADSVDHITPRWLMRGSAEAHSEQNLAAAHFNVAPYCHRSKSTLEGVQSAVAAKKQRALAQQSGTTVQTAGGKSVLKLPAATVNAVIKRAGGVCYRCGEPGADYVEKTDDRAPSVHNLRAVHTRVEPRCYYQEQA